MSARAATAPEPAGVRDGVRAGIPVAMAIGVIGASFGAVAHAAGLSAPLAVAMSALVFSASAQFTAVAIVAAGGGLAPAIVAAALMNSRYLPMGAAVAPSLPGGPLRRALQGMTVVDAAWALASRPDGRFDRRLMFGSALAQYVAWIAGTVAGTLGGTALGDPGSLGLDAAYPAFFLAVLLTEGGGPGALAAAVGGAVIALGLVPVAPAGVPVLAAGAAAVLVALRRRR
jgi:predicted branched-subunit amino acid permease